MYWGIMEILKNHKWFDNRNQITRVISDIGERLIEISLEDNTVLLLSQEDIIAIARELGIIIISDYYGDLTCVSKRIGG